jgi:hypothetical protein
LWLDGLNDDEMPSGSNDYTLLTDESSGGCDGYSGGCCIDSGYSDNGGGNIFEGDNNSDDGYNSDDGDNSDDDDNNSNDGRCGDNGEGGSKDGSVSASVSHMAYVEKQFNKALAYLGLVREHGQPQSQSIADAKERFEKWSAKFNAAYKAVDNLLLEAFGAL